jgi:hypothetical protein
VYITKQSKMRSVSTACVEIPLAVEVIFLRVAAFS